MTDPYETLGVPRTATPAVVKTAFQAKMKALDEAGLSPGERKAEEKALQQAFLTLFDPKKKAEYDRRQAAAAAMQEVPPHATARQRPGILIAGIVVIAGSVGIGWYLTHPSAEKQEAARKEQARIQKALEERQHGAGKNPNPFRNGVPTETKDRIMKQAIEREANKK
jgi:curved DNA-binding protein CbpA